jgi:hypothetical protein
LHNHKQIRNKNHRSRVWSEALNNTTKHALYSQKAKKKAATLGPFGSFLTLPRIALAGAKPAFFALQIKDFRGDNMFSNTTPSTEVFGSNVALVQLMQSFVDS